MSNRNLAQLDIEVEGSATCASSFGGRKVSGISDIVILKSKKNIQNSLVSGQSIKKQHKDTKQVDNYREDIFNLMQSENDINQANLLLNPKERRVLCQIKQHQTKNVQQGQNHQTSPSNLKQQRGKNTMEQLERSSEYPISKMLEKRSEEKSKKNRSQSGSKKSKEKYPKGQNKTQIIEKITKQNLKKTSSAKENLSSLFESHDKSKETIKSKANKQLNLSATQIIPSVQKKQQQVGKVKHREKSARRREYEQRSQDNEYDTEKCTLNTDLEGDQDNNNTRNGIQYTATFEAEEDDENEDIKNKKKRLKIRQNKAKRINSDYSSLNSNSHLFYAKTQKSLSSQNKSLNYSKENKCKTDNSKRRIVDRSRIMSVPQHNSDYENSQFRSINSNTEQLSSQKLFRNRSMSSQCSVGTNHPQVNQVIFNNLKKKKLEELIQRQQQEEKTISQQQRKLEIQIGNEQIRIQNAQRFLKPKAAQNIPFPWGFNQQKVIQIWEKQKKRQQRSIEREILNQIHQIKCDENYRRQQLGLEFLNNFDEKSINILKKNQRNSQSFENKQKLREEHGDLQEFIERKKIQQQEIQKEQTIVKEAQKSKILSNLQKLTESIKKRSQFSHQQSSTLQLSQERQNFEYESATGGSHKKKKSHSNDLPRSKTKKNQGKNRSKSCLKHSSQSTLEKERSYSNGWASHTQSLQPRESEDKFEELNLEFRKIIRSALEEEQIINQQRNNIRQGKSNYKHSSSFQCSEVESVMSQDSMIKAHKSNRSRSSQDNQHLPPQQKKLPQPRIIQKQQQKRDSFDNRREKIRKEMALQNFNSFVNPFLNENDNCGQNTNNSAGTTIHSFITKNSKESTLIKKDNINPQIVDGIASLTPFQQRKINILQKFIDLAPKFEALCGQRKRDRENEEAVPDVPSENDIVEEQLVMEEIQSSQSKVSSNKGECKNEENNSSELGTSNELQGKQNLARFIQKQVPRSEIQHTNNFMEGGGLAQLQSPKAIFRDSEQNEKLPNIPQTYKQGVIQMQYKQNQFTHFIESQDKRNSSIEPIQNKKSDNNKNFSTKQSIIDKIGTDKQSEELLALQNFQKEVFQTSQSFQDLKESSRKQMQVAQSSVEIEGEEYEDQEEKEQLKEIRQIQFLANSQSTRLQEKNEGTQPVSKQESEINIIIQSQNSLPNQLKSIQRNSITISRRSSHKLNSDQYYDSDFLRQEAALVIQKVWKGCLTRKIVKYHLERLKQYENMPNIQNDIENEEGDQEIREMIANYLIEIGQDCTEQEFEEYVYQFKKSSQENEQKKQQINDADIQFNHQDYMESTDQIEISQNNRQPLDFNQINFMNDIEIEDQFHQYQDYHQDNKNNFHKDSKLEKHSPPQPQQDSKNKRTKKKINLGIEIDENEVIWGPTAPQLGKKIIEEDEVTIHQQNNNNLQHNIRQEENIPQKKERKHS